MKFNINRDSWFSRYCLGWRVGDSAAHRLWARVLWMAAQDGRRPGIVKKVFKPKHPELPRLASYKGKANNDFWEKFPKNYTWPGKSLISADQLERLGRQLNIVDDRFRTVLGDLRQGALLGCRGEPRLPSRSSNSSSAYEFGWQVTDAIACWASKGFVHGPVVPTAVPKAAKVNGIMVREKPNGSVRVILNLSAPKGRGVNKGIKKEEFPAQMSSTSKFLEVLDRAGRGCEMVKIDWSDAYKHCPVAAADLDLQWFKWLGMYFCELDLIFGGVSSVGIYDRLAKVVLSVVQGLSGMPKNLICQHLDDVCAAAPAGSGLAAAFDETYAKVAQQIGVRLAPRDEPDKSFGPSTRGIVLGVLYDTVSWTWAVPQDRLDIILNLIWDVIEADQVPAKIFETLVGKIVHVKPLVPDARFHVSELQRAIGDIRREEKQQELAGEEEQIWVVKTPLMVAQLHYWRVVLPACSGRIPIPNPRQGVPATVDHYYTDAAGGSLTAPGQGLGGVGKGWWSYLAWPRPINGDKRSVDGKRLGGKLSFLELLGPLLVVTAGGKVCGGRDVCVWVDNIGSVQIYKRGYSTTCSYASCVARAISVVAARIGCRVYVEKITRCSTREAEAADALSKADFDRFASCWSGSLPEMAWPPRALLAWLADPDTSAPLGELILEDMGFKQADLGWLAQDMTG